MGDNDDSLVQRCNKFSRYWQGGSRTSCTSVSWRIYTRSVGSRHSSFI